MNSTSWEKWECENVKLKMGERGSKREQEQEQEREKIREFDPCLRFNIIYEIHTYFFLSHSLSLFAFWMFCFAALLIVVNGQRMKQGSAILFHNCENADTFFFALFFYIYKCLYIFVAFFFTFTKQNEIQYTGIY